MVYLDIMKPIEKPTDWVNGLMIVKKPNGKLRICLDPRPLNNAIKRENLHLPNAEEIFWQMSVACFLSKPVASSEYWQIKVLAFSSPSGCYRFKRLTYGMHLANEVFQGESTSTISDVSRSADSQDNIIILGITLAEHNERLNKMLLKIRKNGLKLNEKKCQIWVKSIVFLGHTISSEGVTVDPAKLKQSRKCEYKNLTVNSSDS